jgi:hypothetical protein
VLQRDVASGIHRIADAYTNWYLVEGGDRLTVVDTGVPTSWRSLQEALRALGRRPRDIGAGTVLTGHGEPWSQGAAELARRARETPVQ